MELIKLPEPEVDIIEGDFEDAIVAKQTGMPPSRAIEAIALRVEKMHAAAIASSQEPVTHADVVLVTEVAIGMGHNPLSKDFHFWKFRGQMQIADHYAFMVGWAKSIEDFRDVSEVKLHQDGDNPLGWYWEATVCLIRRGQDEHYSRMYSTTLRELISAGIDRLEAIDLAKKAALGEFAPAVAQYEWSRAMKKNNQTGEWYADKNATPAGWVPGATRAYIRALRAAIRHSYGTPSQVERMNYGRINLVKLMQAIDDIPVNMEPIGIQKMAELVAGDTDAPSLPKKERMGLMHPQDEGAIGEDYDTVIPNRPQRWWELVTGTPVEIITAALDLANIKNTDKKPSTRQDTIAWLLGPDAEPDSEKARAVAWFCDAIAGGKINSDRILDFGVVPGDNTSQTKTNLKTRMEEKLANGDFASPAGV